MRSAQAALFMGQEQGRARNSALKVRVPPEGPSAELQRLGQPRHFRDPRSRSSAAPSAGSAKPACGQKRCRRPIRLIVRRFTRAPSQTVALRQLLCLFRGSGHGPIMPAARPTKKPRPESAVCWPGTISIAGCCPGGLPAGKRADPISGLAVGNHAAADHGAGGGCLLPQVPGPCGRTVEGAGQSGRTGPGPGRLGGAWLLRPRPQPACRRQSGGWIEMGGKFPTHRGIACCALPGVGGYTAGAISAIAYDEKTGGDGRQCRTGDRAALCRPDSHAERPRWNCIVLGSGAGAGPGRRFRAGADGSGQRHLHTPSGHACRATARCRDGLSRRASCGIQEQLPVKAPKMLRPLKRGAAFVVTEDKSGAVLLVKRPDKGLLASMLEPPLGEWSEKFPSTAPRP